MQMAEKYILKLRTEKQNDVSTVFWNCSGSSLAVCQRKLVKVFVLNFALFITDRQLFVFCFNQATVAKSPRRKITISPFRDLNKPYVFPLF